MFQKALISTDLEDGLYRLAYAIPSLVESGFKEITFFHNVPVETDRSVPKVDEDEVAAAQAHLEGMVALLGLLALIELKRRSP